MTKLCTLVALCLLAAAAPARAASQAGVAAAVRGSVKVERAAVGSEILSGTKLFLDDKITTGPGAGLQILLLDETVFTLGPDSEMVIDNFVYDPDSARGKLDAKLVKGAFRFISGKVAHKDPRQMNVALPSGTIGIRGTMVFAQVNPDDGHSLVVLAGPGSGNASGESAGAIQVTNAGVAQDVLKSGWGVEVPGFGQPPGEPFQVPASVYDSFNFEVSGPVADATPAGEKGGSASASDKPAAPGTPAAGGAAPEPTSPLAEAGGQFDTAGVAAQADQLLDTSLANVELPVMDPAPPAPPAAPVISATTIADLTNLAGTFTGHYFYNLLDLAFQSGGKGDLLVDLDFTNQVVGVQLVGVSSMALAMMGNGAGATTVPFDNRGVNASYDVPFVYNDTATPCISNGCNADVQLIFENSNANVAAMVSADVTLSAPQFPGQDTATALDVPITSIVP